MTTSAGTAPVVPAGGSPAQPPPIGVTSTVRRSTRRDRGSQALEFALVLPVIAMLLVVVVGVGVLTTTAVATQHLAAGLARRAAVMHDDDVTRDLDPSVVVAVDPPSGRRLPGDILTVHVSRLVRLPMPGGPAVTVTGSASAQTEAVP